jgi:hypothetical protein
MALNLLRENLDLFQAERQFAQFIILVFAFQQIAVRRVDDADAFHSFRHRPVSHCADGMSGKTGAPTRTTGRGPAKFQFPREHKTPPRRFEGRSATMKDTVQSKRRPGADQEPLQKQADGSAADGPLRNGTERAGEKRSKLHAEDGLADDQRNPLAPPITIKSNG